MIVDKRSPQPPRYIQVVHSLPGRTRLRLPWLRHAPEEATGIADALMAVAGIRDVEVRPSSGSVLVSHEAARLEVDGIVAALRKATGVELVVPLGQPPPPPPPVPLRGRVAREVNALFRDLNAGMLRATGGSLDLGTAVTGAFVTAGALQVLSHKELPAPPWFNLAWWGFRTFLAFETNVPVDAESDEGTTEAT